METFKFPKNSGSASSYSCTTNRSTEVCFTPVVVAATGYNRDFLWASTSENFVKFADSCGKPLVKSSMKLVK